jgi:hypothetical protein
MKHTGYTPGPWLIIPDSWPPDIRSKYAFVAEVSVPLDPVAADKSRLDTIEANARLIADAPRLAERVERLEAILRGCADALTEAGKDAS